MYEHRHQAPAKPRVFYARVARHAAVGMGAIAFSLGMGMAISVWAIPIYPRRGPGV